MRKVIWGILAVLSLTFVSCRGKKVPAQSFICMDTVCSVNLYEDGTEKIYKEISDRLLKIEKTFSATDPESFTYKLNKTGSVKTDAAEFSDFYSLYFPSWIVSSLSDGAFDISVNPLIQLWDIKSENPKVPAPDDIAEVLSKVNWKNLPECKMSGGDSVPETFSFGKEGMSINFGAVAKGYAADCICGILRRNKVRKAIIDLGGNIYCFGKKENGKPWTVGIKNPENPGGSPLLKLATEQTSVVTSGTYERFFEEGGKKYHHIMNPKTGYPVDNGLSSVTIICPSSLAADTYSTTFFVLGQEEALRGLSDFEKVFATNLEAVFIYNDGSVSATPGLKGKLDFYGDADGRKINFIQDVKHFNVTTAFGGGQF